MAETETAARKSGSRKAPPVGATVNDQPLPGLEHVNSPERHEDVEAAARAYDHAKNVRVEATADESKTQKNLAGLMQHYGLEVYRGGGVYVHPKVDDRPLKPPKFVVEPDTGEAESEVAGSEVVGADPAN